MSDLESVKKLRSTTGAGFKDCNSALKEASGNLDKAIEILRIKGVSKASKKMSRSATEGVVVTSGDEKKMSLIEVNCETDFVAKNNDFINFVKELSEINNQNNSDVEKLKKSKMKNDITVEENLVALIAKIGEKITIGKTKTISNSASVNYQYLHTVVKDNLAKLAVIVSLETKDNSDIVKTFGKQLSMHIAASNPLALESDLIDKKISMKRLEFIQNLLSENQTQMNKKLENRTIDVLVENLTDDKSKAFGRSEHMTSVIFNGKKNDIGKIMQVRIKDSNRNTLFGEVITNSDQKVA